MIDYHLHTYLCKHAVGTMEEYVLSAIKSNLYEIAFLDHITLRDGVDLSMDIEDIPFYLEEIDKLQEKYQNKITIKKGLEIDFNEEKIDLIEKVVSKFPFDLITSSVHFVNNYNVVGSKYIKQYTKDEKKLFLDLYITELNKMLDYDYFDIVGHLDVIKKMFSNKDDVKDECFFDILHKIKEKNFLIEINTSGYRNKIKEFYPSDCLIQRAIKMGIDLTISSDAHKASEVGCMSDEAVSKIKKFEGKKIVLLKNRKKYDFFL